MRLASMNVFYSMWLLENIFPKSLSLWDSFNRHIVALFETIVLKEIRILRSLRSSVLIAKFKNKAIVY